MAPLTDANPALTHRVFAAVAMRFKAPRRTPGLIQRPVTESANCFLRRNVDQPDDILADPLVSH
jgi:hypothetical protein